MSKLNIKTFSNEEDLQNFIELDSQFFPFPWSERGWREIDWSRHLMIYGEEENGRVVGFCLYQYVFDEAHLFKIIIHPDLRRKRYGERLMEESFFSLVERGVSQIFLEVQSDNNSAVYLYQKLGFQTQKKKEKFYKNGDDAYLMHRVNKTCHPH